jgi:hypothetical protein
MGNVLRWKRTRRCWLCRRSRVHVDIDDIEMDEEKRRSRRCLQTGCNNLYAKVIYGFNLSILLPTECLAKEEID